MSEPYAPLPPPPKGWTLQDAFKATVDKSGQYHVGKLTFPNVQSFNDYKTAQTELGGTPDQLSVLHEIIATGHAPDSGRLAAAPHGTTVDHLLDIRGKTPNAQGMYELGTLRVPKDEFTKFSELQRDLAARDPQALSALYHMENATDRPVTFRVTNDSDRNDRYEPGSNTIYWNPNTAVRDAYNGARVSPDTAALHEETHWAGRKVGDVLANIPGGRWENREEKRVIEGVEAHDMHGLKREPRHSHYGSVLPVDNIRSITPSLTVERSGKEHHVHAPWSQSGHVVGEGANGTTILAIHGDGKGPNDRIALKTEELSFAFGGNLAGARALLRDAHAHNDTVKFELTHDGKMIYSDPMQQQRLREHPTHGLTYPEPMRAVTPTHEHAVQAGVPDPMDNRTHSTRTLTVFQNGEARTVGENAHLSGKAMNFGPLVALENDDGERKSYTMIGRSELIDQTSREDRPALDKALREGRTLSIDIGKNGLTVHDVTPAVSHTPATARHQTVDRSSRADLAR